MAKTPNYETLRTETEFQWFVSSAYPALVELTNIPTKDIYLDPKAGIELYRKGRPMLREMFGEEVGLPALNTPAISYGHINGLGAELFFPDNGEVNHSKPCTTLEKGVELLKSKMDIDFATAGMAPFYLDYRQKMTEAFDGETCGFWYGAEGPMTTAYTLRGNDVFYDPYDNPELFKEFLRLEVESIIKFLHFKIRAFDKEAPLVNPDGSGMCDDLSAMFKPEMWPEFVLPYIDQYYNGLTTGVRSAHIEGLRPDHMPHLEQIGLVYFDPSVSPQINPKIINARCRVPFGWRLVSFHYHTMNCRDVEDFVFQSVADGACRVFTYVSATMCNEPTVEKVHAFIRASKQAEQMLKQGATREKIGECVSAEGKKKFWDTWPE